MTLILDSAPLVAQAEAHHPYKGAARRVLLAEPTTPLLPTPVAVEVDYFLQARGGPGGNRTFLEDLAAGRFAVACLEPGEYVTVAALNKQYRGLDVGLVDLSIVVLAARYRTTRILTFDQRHFRAMRPLQGGAFTLLPFDEPVG
jgi:predicted nucleic acid-binding protein